jgi:hypothetical protein
MKILLVNPPRWNELVGKNPSIIEKHRGFNPPLGLLYLASSLKKNTRFEVEVFDTQPLELTYPQLESVLAQKPFDVVGISAMSFSMPFRRPGRSRKSGRVPCRSSAERMFIFFPKRQSAWMASILP